MAEVVGFKLVLDGKEQVVNSIGEMKKLLKEANFELLAAQQNFGEYSKEALQAANKVATLKDTIQEAGETAQLFDPGKKFQAFAGALSAVAGGFSAVQGALGLVGVESENVEKNLLKVQSALALSQGLSTLADSQKDFQRLSAIIKDTSVVQGLYNFVMKGTINGMSLQNAITKVTAATTNFFKTSINAVTTASITASGAMKVLRGIMASLGIGALIIGVTALIGKIQDWTTSTNTSKAAQDRLNAALEQQDKLFAQQQKSIGQARETALLRAKIANASADELFQINQKYNKLEQDASKNNSKQIEANLLEFERKRLKRTKDGRVEGSKEDIEAYQKAQKELQSAKETERDIEFKNDQEILQNQLRISDERRKKAKESSDKANQEAKQRSDERKQKEKQEAQERLQANNDADNQIRLAKQENALAATKDENERAKKKIEFDLENRLLEIDALKADEEKKAELRLNAIRSSALEIANLEDEIKKEKQEKEKEEKEKREEEEREDFEKRAALTRKQYEYDKKLREEFQAAELEAAKYLQEQKNALLDAGINLVSAIAGRNEKVANAIYAVQKAIEIGRIITSTTGAIAKIKADTFAIPAFVGPGLPNPLFVKALAAMGAKITGLKIGAVASIASIAASSISKFKSGGGGNIGGTQDTGTVAGGGGSAPIAPAQPQAQLTQLDQRSINQLGSATNRAYVVESDITNSQERIRRINRAARLN